MWGLLALRLADDHILPMKYGNYVNELRSYTLSIILRLKDSNAPDSISCTPLITAIKDLEASTLKVTQELQVKLRLYAFEWRYNYVEQHVVVLHFLLVT